MRVPLILLASVVLLTPACKLQKAGSSGTASTTRFGSDTDPQFFSLERTPCFGKCPAYTVTINADGTARYVGRSNAERQGTFKGTVNKATMQALFDRAKEIGFFGFEDKYDGHITDIPSTIIRVNADGKDKKVVGRYQTPPAFKPFAAFADSLLAPVQWTKVAAEQ